MDVPLEPCAAVGNTPAGDRILTAAARLFHNRGITTTGVDRIVDEAGTTKRTLYQRFGSKDALVAAYLQQRAHQWQAELLAALHAAAHDASDGLDVVYEQAQRWATDGWRGCAFVNAWAETSTTDHQALAVIRDEKTWMRNLFTHLADGDHHNAAVLHILYEGAQIAAAIHHDPTTFVAARRASNTYTA